MITGSVNKNENKNKKDGGKPIVLSMSLCLILDILLVGMSFALLLLLASNVNMPNEEDTKILEKHQSSMMIISSLRDAKVLSLCATFFTWTTSMFAGIYTISVLQFKCCPWLKTQIIGELLRPRKDEANDDSDSGFFEN